MVDLGNAQQGRDDRQRLVETGDRPVGDRLQIGAGCRRDRAPAPAWCARGSAACGCHARYLRRPRPVARTRVSISSSIRLTIAASRSNGSREPRVGSLCCSSPATIRARLPAHRLDPPLGAQAEQRAGQQSEAGRRQQPERQRAPDDARQSGAPRRHRGRIPGCSRRTAGWRPREPSAFRCRGYRLRINVAACALPSSGRLAGSFATLPARRSPVGGEQPGKLDAARIIPQTFADGLRHLPLLVLERHVGQRTRIRDDRAVDIGGHVHRRLPVEEPEQHQRAEREDARRPAAPSGRASSAAAQAGA